MDQQTGHMIRTDIRLRRAPFFLLVWLCAGSFIGVGLLALIAYLAGLEHRHFIH